MSPPTGSRYQMFLELFHFKGDGDTWLLNATWDPRPDHETGKTQLALLIKDIIGTTGIIWLWFGVSKQYCVNC